MKHNARTDAKCAAFVSITFEIFRGVPGPAGPRRGNLFRGEYCAINKKRINKSSRRGGTSWQFLLLLFFFFFFFLKFNRGRQLFLLVEIPAGRFSNVKIAENRRKTPCWALTDVRRIWLERFIAP